MPVRVALVVVLALAACPSRLGPDRAPCTSAADCAPGEGCADGACVPSSAAPCDDDFDCDFTAGQLCVNGACAVSDEDPTTTCASTADCPDDRFCNTTGICLPLVEGWCRLPDQCAAPTPICRTDSSSRPGLCVACVTDADCSEGTCDDGDCVVAEVVECPANASLVPGSTTVCQCDAGFAPDPSAGTCRAIDAPDEEPVETECVPNASPVPGIPGQCRCNTGFEPNADGSACVPSGEAPPPVDDGGGGVVPANPDDEEEETCGPNSFPLFFLCVCEPGFVVNDDGPGCVLDDGSGGPDGEPLPTDDGCPFNASPDPEDELFCVCDPGFEADASGSACVPESFGNGDDCPPNASPDPDDDAFCICDDGFVVEGGACVPDDDDGCPANASPDPTDDSACLCDEGFVVDDTGTACVEDTSPQDECPPNSSPDPDDDAFCICDEGFVVDGGDCVQDAEECPANSSPTGNGFCACDEGFVVDDSGTRCIEDICETNGFYGDGEFCDDFCPFADPDCA